MRYWILLLILMPLTVPGQEARQYNIQGRKYAFSLFATRSISEDKTNYTCGIDSIVITDKKSGNKIQTIICKENNYFCTDTEKPGFVTEDMNFDGEEDFRLMQFLPAGPNIPYYYWLYNAKTGRFEPNTQLEDITSPVFDKRSKRIASEWRNGAAESGKTLYEYRKGIPTAVEERSMDYGQKEGYILYTTKKLTGGKLKTVSKKLVKE
jgi:hypothetical protein